MVYQIFVFKAAGYKSLQGKIEEYKIFQNITITIAKKSDLKSVASGERAIAPSKAPKIYVAGLPF